MRTIQSEIKRHGLHEKKKVTTNCRKPNKRKEQLSKWEIEDLMGGVVILIQDATGQFVGSNLSSDFLLNLFARCKFYLGKSFDLKNHR